MKKSPITDAERDQFDREVETVLADLPREVLDKMADAALVVEDYPTRRVLHEQGLEHPDELCGLFAGRPFAEPSETFSQPATVLIYRLGVLTLADEAEPADYWAEVRRQIRITILHEYGHYYGLDEDDLRALGYE